MEERGYLENRFTDDEELGGFERQDQSIKSLGTTRRVAIGLRE
jgi:hypothetical protein